MIAQLKKRNIYYVATLRMGRPRECSISSEREMEKQGRGKVKQYVKKGKVVVINAWYDNRRVIMVLNFLGRIPEDEVRRFDKKKEEIISVSHSASVDLYNLFMGGVDKTDMFLALYHRMLRTRKWYMQIVIHLIEIAAVNTYVIYNQIGGPCFYLDFLVDISLCWCASNSMNSSTSSDEESSVSVHRLLKACNVPLPTRFDGRNQYSHQTDTSLRCKAGGVTGSKCFFDISNK